MIESMRPLKTHHKQAECLRIENTSVCGCNPLSWQGVDTRVLFAKIGIQGLHGAGFIITLHLTELIVKHSQDSFQI